jgi:hypothetical protein
VIEHFTISVAQRVVELASRRCVRVIAD